MLHHPPYAPSGDALAAGLRRDLLPVLRRHGFQLLLLGHVHAYERTRPLDGMTHVAVGTGGAEIGHVRWTTAPLAASSYGRFGALRLDVGPRVATGAFVTVDGVTRTRFSVRCRPSRQLRSPRTRREPAWRASPAVGGAQELFRDDGPRGLAEPVFRV